MGGWTIVHPGGDADQMAPAPRGGHTCIRAEDGKIVLFGGGNPSGVLRELYVLDTDGFKWSRVAAGSNNKKGPAARYEHGAVRVGEKKMLIFGGADMERSYNDVHVLNTETLAWKAVKTNGSPPSPRTAHSIAAVGPRVFVFMGGASGSDAVDDSAVHVLHTKEANQWSVIDVQGTVPSPRFGHSMTAVGGKIYIFGGMSGSEFFGDLYILDTETAEWSKPTTQGDGPGARSGHAAVSVGSAVYIFGGMGCPIAHDGKESADSASEPKMLNDLYVLDTATLTWSPIVSDTEAPPARLDHSLTPFKTSRYVGNDKEDRVGLLVFGGMDASGNIFNDCHAFDLEIPVPDSGL